MREQTVQYSYGHFGHFLFHNLFPTCQREALTAVLILYFTDKPAHLTNI